MGSSSRVSVRVLGTTLLVAALACGFALGSIDARVEARHGLEIGSPTGGALTHFVHAEDAGAMAEAEPGVWSIELGGFTRLVDSIAFSEDDIWAVGDGIVHYDGSDWNQVAGFEHPTFHAIDGLTSEQLWVVGEVSQVGCDRSGFVMRRDGRGWRAEPVETHQPLFDVAMVSDTDGWAVGGVEVPVILRYDGARWRETGAPETGGLRAVHMINEDSGWAVGDRGAIVRYDGQHWLAVRSPTWSTLLDVHMLDEDVGWAVGIGDYYSSGIILAFEGGEWFVDLDGRTPVLGAVFTLGPTTALAVGEHGVLTYFDGDDWREIGRTYPGGFTPYDGDAFEPASGDEIVVQASGAPSPLADATAREHRILRPSRAVAPPGAGATESFALPRTEVDGGPMLPPTLSDAAPRQEPNADRPGEERPDGGIPAPGYRRTYGNNAMLNGLSLMPDAETLLAVGDAGQVVVIDDQTWSEVHAGRRFVALDMRTAYDGWIVGPDGSPLHWDGTGWTAHRVPRRARYLHDVAAVGPDDAWAVGENGAVVRWDGSKWSQWPSFTTVDLSAVSFSAPDDGWIVANIYDELMYTREARVFRWDGSGWNQVFRLCHGYIHDVAAASPTDVWLATGDVYLLHYDGEEWAWEPVLGQELPQDYGAHVSRITLTPDGGWGTGAGLARYDGHEWRTVEPSSFYGYRYVDVAAVDRRSLWGISQFYEYVSTYFQYDDYREGYGIYHRGATGDKAVAHEGAIDLSGIDAVTDDDGVLHVWAVGGASTVLHYGASGPGAALPESTATPRLPAPELRPSPTPRSSLRSDDVRDMILSRYDPDGERGLRVTRVELSTASEVQDLLSEFTSDDFWILGQGWRNYSDSCYSWRPIWFAVVEGDVRCSYSDGPRGTHAVMVLDGATGREEMTLCVAAIQSRLHLPIAVGGGSEPWVYPTREPRDLTPQPIEDTEGPCPTQTPYPDEPYDPPIGYP